MSATPPPAAWGPTTTVTVPDGRTLEVSDTGGDGPVVVLHHGTPHSFLPATSALRVAGDLGLRLVTWPRPGYGASTRHPGRRIADVAADTEAVLRHLGVDTAYAAGTSGGGPHALACGALLPERILGVASISGVAPYDDPRLDFLRGMGQDNLDEFAAALEGEQALREFLEPQVPSLRALDADALFASMGSLLPPVDRQSLQGSGAEVAEGLALAVAAGVDGWVDDDLAFVAPWGFELADVRVPTAVWQGGQDLMVPLAHGEHLSGELPHAVSHLLPDEGHLSLLVTRIGDILSELVAPRG